MMIAACADSDTEAAAAAIHLLAARRRRAQIQAFPRPADNFSERLSLTGSASAQNRRGASRFQHPSTKQHEPRQPENRLENRSAGYSIYRPADRQAPAEYCVLLPGQLTKLSELVTQTAYLHLTGGDVFQTKTAKTRFCCFCNKLERLKFKKSDKIRCRVKRRALS
jgi:hypothetical protein